MKGDISILVVDDNEVNLTIALGFLAAYDISTDTAASGMEAINKIKERAAENSAYNLVFMDYMMPNMDGIESVKQIRKWEKETGQTGQIPIVALTANKETGVEKKFLKAGVNGFISKPIIAGELNHVLAQLLPHHITGVAKNTQDVYDAAGEEGQPGSRLLEELSQIKNLDVKAGIKNAGQNRESYLLALKQFSDNCGSYLENLNAAMKEGAWKDYSIMAHALKGVLASLGAQRFSQWASNLENASKGDLPTDGKAIPAICLEETAPFSAALAKFQASLRQILDQQESFHISPSESKGKEKPRGDEKFLAGQMDLLGKACMELSDEAEKIIGSLFEYEWTSETRKGLEKINSFVRSYDFEAAAGIINKYTEKRGFYG